MIERRIEKCESIAINQRQQTKLITARIIAIVFLLAAMFSGFSAPLQEIRITANNITPSASFQSGDGTRENPYIIQTAAQLSYLANVINNNIAGFNTSSLYYAMGADINFNSNHTSCATYGTTPPANNWNKPIGDNATTNARFKANFDGRGFTIRGLYINSSESNKGLFGYAASGARITGIAIENSYIKASTAVGAVVGFTENTVNISNCRNINAYVEATGNGSAGGIVGTFGNGRIDDCSSTGAVKANYDALSSSSRYAGGIAGYVNGSGAVINSCINTGAIQGFRMGGMFGYSGSSVIVSNCYNSGTMTGTLHAVDTANIASYCQTYQGGIAGQTGSSSVFINCRNTATITGTGTMSAQPINGGGIVGNSSSNTAIYNCYNSGNISYTNLGGIRNGGILGESSGGTIIMGAISMGSVSGDTQSGSIAGFWSSNVGHASYCFYQNSVSATNKLVGYNSSIIAGANGNASINTTGVLASPTSILYSGTTYTNAFNALNAWAVSSPAIQTTIKLNPINVSSKEFQTTITFDSQGGSAKTAVTKNMNTQYTATEISAVTKANYTFQGWWTRLPSGDWGVKLSAQNYATETRTVYARWTPVEVISSVTVNLTYMEVGGGTITMGTAPTSPKTHISNAATVLPTMSFSGYRFDGWCLKSDGSDMPLMVLAADLYTADLTLYAKWTRIKYDVVFLGNGGTGTMAEQPFFQNESKALSANSFAPASGNTFRGWATTPTGAVSRANQEIVSNLSSVHNAKVYLYAAWTTNTTLYSMTAVTAGDPEGGKIISGGNASLVQTAASLISINTEPGFEAVATTTSGSVSASVANSVYRFTMANANATVTITFSGISYYYSFNANGGSGSMGTQTRKYNELLALPLNTTMTRIGHTFIGWNTAANGSGTQYEDGKLIAKTHVIPTKSQTITLFAQWEPNSYFVTYNPNPPREDMAVLGSMDQTTLIYNDANGNLANNNFKIQGRVFKGWAITKGGSVIYTNNQSVKNLTDENQQVVELFAVWDLETFNNIGYEQGKNKFEFTDVNRDKVVWTDYVLGDEVFLENVAPDESLEKLLQQFDNRLRVRNKEGVEIHENDTADTIAATGMKLELLGYGEEVLSSAMILVLGDLTGTGTVDMADISHINNHRLYHAMGTATAEKYFKGEDARLKGTQLMSADINSNGIINMGLVISVNNYRLYKEGSDPFTDIRIKK